METSTRFSSTELSFVIINCVISKLFLIYPSVFSKLGASASIILSLATVGAGLVFVLIVNFLYKGKKTDITRVIDNKAFGKIISILISISFLLNQILFVRSVSESIKISILPETPLCFITAAFMLGVFICSYTGIKSIIRAHSFILPFTVAMLLILLVSSVGNIKLHQIFPIMGNGYNMFLKIWVLTSYFADMLILFILIPFSSEKTTFKKISITSYTASSIILVLVISLCNLIIPYSNSHTFFIPLYKIAQYINYESFMSRLESVFSAGWIMSYFACSSTYLYVISMLVGRLFNTKSNRPIMLIAAIIITISSLIPKNTTELVDYSNKFSVIRFVIGIMCPIVILIISKLYRRAK